MFFHEDGELQFTSVRANCQVSCQSDFDITISGRLPPSLESLIVIFGQYSYISAYLFAAFLITVGNRHFDTFISPAPSVPNSRSSHVVVLIYLPTRNKFPLARSREAFCFEGWIYGSRCLLLPLVLFISCFMTLLWFSTLTAALIYDHGVVSPTLYSNSCSEDLTRDLSLSLNCF